MLEANFDPHSRKLRFGRISEPLACYSITKNVDGRQKLLASKEISEIVMESWNYLRKEDQIRVLAFCIMPDHYHLLLCLLNKKSLSDVIASISKFTSRQISSFLGRSGRFWQEGFHDHRCRDGHEADDLSVYIEHNPVRAGLVESAEQWPYSSGFPLNHQLLDRNWYSQVK